MTKSPSDLRERRVILWADATILAIALLGHLALPAADILRLVLAFSSVVAVPQAFLRREPRSPRGPPRKPR